MSDSAIAVLLSLLTFAGVLLGVRMAWHPPNSTRPIQKWLYLCGYAIVGFASVTLVWVQASRAARSSERADKAQAENKRLLEHTQEQGRENTRLLAELRRQTERPIEAIVKFPPTPPEKRPEKSPEPTGAGGPITFIVTEMDPRAFHKVVGAAESLYRIVVRTERLLPDPTLVFTFDGPVETFSGESAHSPSPKMLRGGVVVEQRIGKATWEPDSPQGFVVQSRLPVRLKSVIIAEHR